MDTGVQCDGDKKKKSVTHIRDNAVETKWNKKDNSLLKLVLTGKSDYNGKVQAAVTPVPMVLFGSGQPRSIEF